MTPRKLAALGLTIDREGARQRAMGYRSDAPPPGYDGPKPCRSNRRNRVHVTEDWRSTLCGRPCDGWQVADAVPTCRVCLVALAART